MTASAKMVVTARIKTHEFIVKIIPVPNPPYYLQPKHLDLPVFQGTLYSRRQDAPGPDAGGKAKFYLSLRLF
ncbi:MAG: hypothetical protein F6K58_14195 [Symploca sp. SIO2E9]|nr:hypothetical protein [Symploca sp. SIO2E9]